MSSHLSLYDMYFSKKNKNHIFTIITDLVLKETGLDINSSSEYIDLYRFKYSLIFERSNVDNIIDLNKELIDEIAPLLISDVLSKYNRSDVTISKAVDKNESSKEESKENHTMNDKIKNKKITMNKILLNSSKRNINSLNRYNYKIDFVNQIYKIILHEITIPEENNILFENPTICVRLRLGEKEVDIFCRYSSSIELKGTKYNIYRPALQLVLEVDKPQKELSIQILTNSLLDILDKTDIIRIQKIKNINYKGIKQLCIMTDDHNFKENNLVGIYLNDILIKIKTISEIKNNYLLFEDEQLEYKKDENYYLIGFNLQHDIIIEYL